jgi:hypothetical protein
VGNIPTGREVECVGDWGAYGRLASSEETPNHQVSLCTVYICRIGHLGAIRESSAVLPHLSFPHSRLASHTISTKTSPTETFPKMTKIFPKFRGNKSHLRTDACPPMMRSAHRWNRDASSQVAVVNFTVYQPDPTTGVVPRTWGPLQISTSSAIASMGFQPCFGLISGICHTIHGYLYFSCSFG